MSEGQLLAASFATVAALGILLPRLYARFRLARAIDHSLNDGRRNSVIDLSHAAAYYDALGVQEHPDTVDNATWKDLDLDAVFIPVDHTASEIGRQFLYNALRQTHFTAAPIARVEEATQRFITVPEDAARVREILKPLAHARAAHLSDLLFAELPARPPLWWIFPLLSVTSVACLVLLFVWPKVLVVWLVVCLVNIAVQLVYRPRVKQFIVGLQSMPAFIRAADQLSQLSPTGIEQDAECFREDAPKLLSLRRATSWLLFEPGSANELASTAYEYVNMLFLIDINAFVFSMQRIHAARARLHRVFTAIGRIDMAQSIARWRKSLQRWTVPEFTRPAKALEVKRVFHPLLTHPVANSLSVSETSILITGSNMAGKTTFMRTLGVNAVLAQSLNTVCAERWVAPFLQVRSSIGRTDSLLDGRSHYFAEVESVHALLRAKSDDRQHFYLLDELFRGTNTLERVAAAYGVLVYLTRGNDVVVVATHDVELVALLEGAYASYHFREHIVDDTLSFDYQLRPGPSSTRNAIAVLQLQRYPDAIIADAMAILDRTPQGD